MSNLNYRPEIDGLRALAVIVVMLFHVNPQLIPGGFVGVDIFFVISGYLITAIIQKSIAAGSFSFTGFYHRRVVRLMPTFLASTLATLIAAFFLYEDLDLANLGALTTATALCLANVKNMVQTDYFAASKDALPLLHHWSLAVEEQFYLVFPGLLCLLHRCRVRGRGLYVVLSTCLGLSFLLGVVLSSQNPRFAFYMLPTRAWELLAGCVLALVPAALPRAAGNFRDIGCRVLSIGLLVAALALCREDRPHPGLQALVPVLGACLFLRTNWQGSVLKWLFVNPVAVYVGLASYSLYLWHWPVFCLVDYSMLMSSEMSRLAVKCAATAVLAIGCYELLEKPLRYQWLPRLSRRVLFAGTAACLGALAMVGYVTRSEYWLDSSPSSIAAGGLEYRTPHARARVALVGDSNAVMYGNEFRAIARHLHLDANILAICGGQPLPSLEEPHSQLWLDILHFAETQHPDVVVVGCGWKQKLAGQRGRAELLVSELLKHCKKVILLTQIPELPPKANRTAVRRGVRPPFFEDAEVRARRLEVKGWLLALAGDRVSVVDVDDLLLSTIGEIAVFDSDTRLNYHDDTHLSGRGAGILFPRLRSEILRAMEYTTEVTLHQARP